jgi:hypothetical protein
MAFRRALLIMAICYFVGTAVRAQLSRGGTAASITDKVTTPTGCGTGAWTEEQIATTLQRRQS